MNRVFIIGNLTNDPDMRVTAQGVNVCSFGVAVNSRHSTEAKKTDFFRVTAWRGLADNCKKYLSKGRKVAVTGSVSVSSYKASNGETRFNLEVTADDVEFLSPKQEQEAAPTPPAQKYVEVVDEELPF